MVMSVFMVLQEVEYVKKVQADETWVRKARLIKVRRSCGAGLQIFKCDGKRLIGQSVEGYVNDEERICRILEF